MLMTTPAAFINVHELELMKIAILKCSQNMENGFNPFYIKYIFLKKFLERRISSFYMQVRADNLDNFFLVDNFLKCSRKA